MFQASVFSLCLLSDDYHIYIFMSNKHEGKILYTENTNSFINTTGDLQNMTLYSQELIRSAVATDSFSTLPGRLYDTIAKRAYPRSGFSFRILIAGERCNLTTEYFESGSMSEQKTVLGYRTLAGEFSVVNGEFSDL